MLSRVFTTQEQFLMLGFAAAIVVGCTTIYFMRSAPDAAPVEVQEIVVSAPPPAVEVEPPPQIAIDLPLLPAPEPERRVINVSVTGAVATPGVYEFREHDRVEKAIEAAGGASDKADLSDINRAAELIDGSALVIPVAGVAGVQEGNRLVVRQGQAAAALNPPEYTISGWNHAPRAPAPAASAAAPTAVAPAPRTNSAINLNTASADELQRLPGVGPKLADAIIEYRTRQPFQTVDELDNVPGFGEKRVADIRPHVTVSPQ